MYKILTSAAGRPQNRLHQDLSETSYTQPQTARIAAQVRAEHAGHTGFTWLVPELGRAWYQVQDEETGGSRWERVFYCLVGC